MQRFMYRYIHYNLKRVKKIGKNTTPQIRNWLNAIIHIMKYCANTKNYVVGKKRGKYTRCIDRYKNKVREIRLKIRYAI